MIIGWLFQSYKFYNIHLAGRFEGCRMLGLLLFSSKVSGYYSIHVYWACYRLWSTCFFLCLYSIWLLSSLHEFSDTICALLQCKVTLFCIIFNLESCVVECSAVRFMHKDCVSLSMLAYILFHEVSLLSSGAWYRWFLNHLFLYRMWLGCAL